MGVKEIDEWVVSRLITKKGGWDTNTITLILCAMEDKSPISYLDLEKGLEYTHLVDVACDFFLSSVKGAICDCSYTRQQGVDGLQELLERVSRDKKTFWSPCPSDFNSRYKRHRIKIIFRKCIKKILNTKKILESPECVRSGTYR